MSALHGALSTVCAPAVFPLLFSTRAYCARQIGSYETLLGENQPKNPFKMSL